MSGFTDILGALYLAVLFLGLINASSVQPIVFYERSVSTLLTESDGLRHGVLLVCCSSLQQHGH